MPEPTAYFDNVVAQRSILLSPEDALAGTTTLSIETVEAESEQNVFTYIEEHFGEFLVLLRYLKPEDQELLLSYYLLGKSQTTLAPVFKSTQTVCSFRIRSAVKTLCAFMMMGKPTQASMEPILTRNGLETHEYMESLPMSLCVEMYARVRSFQEIAEAYHLHRPSVRRNMSRTSKKLLAAKDAESHALGAYIFSLIDKASPTARGFTKRQRSKQGNLYRTDSSILGDFRVSVDDPDFDQFFIGRAAIR